MALDIILENASTRVSPVLMLILPYKSVTTFVLAREVKSDKIGTAYLCASAAR